VSTPLFDAAERQIEQDRKALQIGRPVNTPEAMPDDITANYHGGNPESVAANEVVRPNKVAMQRQIYEWIPPRGKSGATCYEVEKALDLKHQTASARMSEMKLPGSEFHIFWNGMKRSTGASTAKVFVTSEGQIL
jgi:hypothetical protein